MTEIPCLEQSDQLDLRRYLLRCTFRCITDWQPIACTGVSVYHMYMCMCMSCTCILRGKDSVTCRCSAKLHQGQHILKWTDHNGIASRTCILLTAGLSKLFPQNMQGEKRKMWHCAWNRERETLIWGKKREKPTPERHSACTRLGHSTSKRANFRGRAGSVPNNAT